jgi:lambda repressor-like predicted transcriptional regulator
MLKLDVDKIKKEMAKRDLTVIDMSKRLGVTSAWIYDIFTRRPIKQADMFAEDLGLDPKDLIVNE